MFRRNGTDQLRGRRLSDQPSKPGIYTRVYDITGKGVDLFFYAIWQQRVRWVTNMRILQLFFLVYGLRLWICSWYAERGVSTASCYMDVILLFTYRIW